MHGRSYFVGHCAHDTINRKAGKKFNSVFDWPAHLTLEAPAYHQPKYENQCRNTTTHHQLKPQVLKPHLSPELSPMPVEVVSLGQI
jgi:hypothetical protein